MASSAFKFLVLCRSNNAMAIFTNAWSSCLRFMDGVLDCSVVIMGAGDGWTAYSFAVCGMEYMPALVKARLPMIR